MSATGWLLFVLLVQVIHGLGTWKLYEKAGRKAIEAFIPVYNSIVLMKIINRPTWWTLLLFIPIINLFMFPIIWIETLRTFGKKTTKDMLLGVFTLGLYILFVNYTDSNIKYHADRDLKAPTKIMDTIGSLSFAIIVATFVHTYFIQPFIIPTSSLEKSLLIGDFLFVSKFHYGPRTPMTTLAAPMVHDTLPIVKTKSYNTWPQLPYFRLPGFQKIERNDIVVFNYPADTSFHMYIKTDKRYDKPIDKKTNYVKRCTGIPGDTLEIKDGIIFINGKESIMPDRAKPQYNHFVYSKKGVNSNFLLENGSTEFTRKFVANFQSNEQIDMVNQYIRNAVKNPDGSFTIFTDAKGIPSSVLREARLSLTEVNDFEKMANLTLANAEKIRKNEAIDSVIRIIQPKSDQTTDLYPGNTNWTADNLGPVYIPKAGKTISINKENLAFYKKIISEYEGHKLDVNGNEIRIDGQVANSYTFEQNYYWMMGDNRHNSLDGRFWGYTPEDHVVGKPVFIWMSIDGINDGIKNWKIRWDRLFTTVGGDGQPKSYFRYFLILLALYFVGEHFWKKRKKAKADL